MTSKIKNKQNDRVRDGDNIEPLYLKFLRAFYEREDRAAAAEIAKKLESALRRQPKLARSIRGEEIRSLLAELRGDLTEAIRSRESEIRKIFELHSLSRSTPSWDYVLRKYNFTDLSDRLDLLAGLYAEQGDLRRAVDTLHESKQFCTAHGIAFDGQELLNEYEATLARKEGAAAHSQRRRRQRSRSASSLAQGID
jgi:hypothetical protein